MISRGKTLAAALVLCALSICAFAAASASASELTAVTCKEVTLKTGNYNNNHCNTPKVAESNFETVALPLNTPTNVSGGTTEGGTGPTEPALRATQGGASITIVCGSSELVGATLENKEPSAGKHTVKTTATRDTYSNCHAVLMSNEARFCSIEGMTAPGGVGTISTTALVGTTTGVEHKVKVEPAAGTEVTKYTIQKKGTNATENECFLNHDILVSITGAVEGEANTTKHSHLTFTAANNGTALKVNGATATYIDTVGGSMEGTENTVGAETFT